MRLIYDIDEADLCFSTTLAVRFSDVNLGGHVGNDALVEMLSEARMRFWDWLGVKETAQPGMILSDLLVVYRAEAYLRDELRFDLGIVDVNRYGGDLAFRIVRASDGAVIATGKNGIVFYDYTTKTVSTPQPAFSARFPPATQQP